jgi:hypothetical protein
MKNKLLFAGILALLLSACNNPFFPSKSDTSKSSTPEPSPPQDTPTPHQYPVPVTIIGLVVGDKIYDGTTIATISGTPIIEGLISGDTVSVVQGTASFADKNAGEWEVTFSGFALSGADAGNYTLSAQPTSVTANITPYSLADDINISRTWLSPIDREFAASITFKPPPAETDLVNVTFTLIPPVSLPAGLGYNAGTQTFSYEDEGRTAFANPHAGNFTVTANTDNSNYTNGTQTFAINVYDGQTDFSGTGYDRRIPVAQDNITAFNRYANSTDGLARHYKLVENVTLAAPENDWTAIGADSFPFAGSFDGQNNTITGININKPTENYQGFLNVLSGTVRNLGLVGGTIIGGNFVGGVVGRNVGTVQNCYATGDVSCNSDVGGVVGLNYGTVQNCYATGDVSGDRPGSFGGVVGRNVGTVQNCYATGDVSGDNNVGGVVGVNNGTVQNCYATGDVSGLSYYVGGVVGHNNVGGTVQNCVALSLSVRTRGTYVVRVVWNINDGTSSNNYARNPMIVQSHWNGSAGRDEIIDAGLNTMDGENITAMQWNDASWWTTAGNWDTTNGSAWDSAVWDIADGRLPILRISGIDNQ